MSILIALALQAVAAPAVGPVLPVHVGGRTIREADGNYAFGWPGVYFEARFHGTAVRVRFEAKEDFLRLLVDGREQRTFRRPGVVDFLVSGLPNTVHTIRLEKLTESQQGGSRFTGFYAMPKSTPLPSAGKRRQIEFIGDSYTVGYGNLSDTRTCTRAEVHDRTDTQAAFGPSVARHYGADYRINAYSGIGIVRNYGGSNPSVTMPLLYWHAMPQMDAPLDRDTHDWEPQVVVVNLGTNDFSTALHAGERWATQSALQKDYVESYSEFMKRVHAREPGAALILMGSEQFYPQVQQVAAVLKQAGINRVTTLQFTGLDHGGCDFHPSLEDDRKLAETIEQAIDAAKFLPR